MIFINKIQYRRNKSMEKTFKRKNMKNNNNFKNKIKQ